MKARTKSFRMLPIAFGVATMAISAPAVFAADAASAKPAEGFQIEEVIITARKTEESAQVVPVSVTALSSAALQKQAVLTVTDLQTSVPGLVIAPNSQGGAPTFAIRAAKADNGTSDTVTAYVDDMPVASTKAIGNMVYDMQSISVLKGPQGTLFGAATTGGAIIFRPNKPSNVFEGYAEVGIGNYGRQQFQGMINVPVNDVLQVRLAGDTVRRDGFERNNPKPGSKFNGITDYANDKHDSLRLSVRLKPSATFQNDLVLNYFNEDDQPNQAITVATRSRFNYNTFLGFAAPVDYAKAGIFPPKDRNSLQLSPDPTWNKANVWDAADTATYEISDDASLKGVLTYQSVKTDTLEQNGGMTNVAVDGRTTHEVEQWTFEPSIDTKWMDGRFRNKTGLFVSTKKDTTQNIYEVIGLPWDASGLFPGAGALLNTFYPLGSNSRFNREFKSHAVYTQFAYDLSKELTATLGLRYTWDTGNYIYRNYIATGGAQGPFPYVAYNQGNCSVANLAQYFSFNTAKCEGYATYKSQAPSFTFTLEDKYAENSMVYASVRGGYLVGGFNNGANPAIGNPVLFQPEHVVDVETGVKSDWELWNRPIRTNLAVFYGNYKDQQRVQNGTAPGGTTFIGVTNAGASSFYGLDLDVTYDVTDNLELHGSWNHIETEYTKFSAIVNIPLVYAYVDLSGQPMSQTPKDVVNLSATAKWPLSADVGKVSSTLSWFWRAKTTSHDSPTIIGTTNASGLITTITSNFTQYDVLPAFDLFNFTTEWKGIMGSKFDANFWVKNLTDKKYQLYNSNQFLQFGYATATYGNPREIGLNVRYNF